MFDSRKLDERVLTGAMDFYTSIFAFVGFLAVANWTYTTFRSLFWVAYYNVLEQLNPEKYSLEKRFGQWAGKKGKDNLCFALVSIQLVET